MISAQTYLEHVRRDGDRISQVSEGHLDDDVPTCPGNTVGSLVMHCAGTCIFWTDAMRQNRRPDQRDWSTLPTEPIALFEQAHREFVDELASRDPNQPTWTWTTEGPTRFWYRRSAQELAVHRWDFEHAVGEPLPIDPTLALDGIDEFLYVFGPATGQEQFKGASERFDGNGEVFHLDPTDIDGAVTFAALANRFEPADAASPDVTARGSASDLLLFVWGRVGPDRLEVSGNASLLERWQDRVKI